MTAMTFDSTEPAYASASTAADPRATMFGNTAIFERLQGRRKPASKMPYILAGALVVAGLGAYGVSELMSNGAAEPVPAAAPAARLLPAAPVVTPAAEIAPAAPLAVTPAPVPPAPVVERPAPRPAVRPAARAAPTEPAPAVSAAAAPTVVSAPPPVLSLPAPATAASPESTPAPLSSPPPINPDPGAAIQ